MSWSNILTVYRKELRVYGVDTRRLDAVACAKLLAQMANGFESGKLTAKPGKPFPIAAAVDAYQQAAIGGVRITLRPDLGIEGNG